MLSKILLVVWIFIITCKLVFRGIALVENNIAKIKFERGMYIPVLKTAILVILAAALAYTGKAVSADGSIADSGSNSSDELAAEPDANF
ncbi:MAG: hypothetical protein ABI707_14910 [Ferruginibacter sp.]